MNASIPNLRKPSGNLNAIYLKPAQDHDDVGKEGAVPGDSRKAFSYSQRM
ncbi:uncharacterized protein RSE6_10939 [Rhynchosporium secalis]|uniref:Uncharacterized protein n=1 Tax=Rhynchosporium secalis TaxID=38038 RepID=A0A1E1MLP9_RHYSE|nr:uncharacterized protein RSE6_10939 [Rhynchosporium secalis]